MKSTKCPQCGFVYWSDVPSCKRCGLANPAMESQAPDSPAQSSYAPAHPADHYPYPHENAAIAHDPLAAPIRWDMNSDPVMEGFLKTIKANACFFYVLGTLQALLWLVVGNLLIVDGVLNIGLALIIHKFKSRVAAVLLLCLTGLSVLGAVIYALTNGFGLMLLAPITLIFRVIASIKLVSTTFQLYAHQAEMEPMQQMQQMPPAPPDFNQGAAPQW